MLITSVITNSVVPTANRVLYSIDPVGASPFAVGMTLFLITLALNIVSIRFVRKYRQVYE